MSHNPHCQCKTIAINVIVLDKTLAKNNSNIAIEGYIAAFTKNIKGVCPEAKNKNIALAAAYITAGHDDMNKIIQTIVQGTKQDCNLIKEETKQDKEPAVEKSSTTEEQIPSEDLKLFNEQLTKVFEKGIKASIIRVPKEKEE